MGSADKPRPFKVNPKASRASRANECAAELQAFCNCFMVRPLAVCSTSPSLRGLERVSQISKEISCVLNFQVSAQKLCQHLQRTSHLSTCAATSVW